MSVVVSLQHVSVVLTISRRTCSSPPAAPSPRTALSSPRRSPTCSTSSPYVESPFPLTSKGILTIFSTELPRLALRPPPGAPHRAGQFDGKLAGGRLSRVKKLTRSVEAGQRRVRQGRREVHEVRGPMRAGSLQVECQGHRGAGQVSDWDFNLRQ